MLKGVQNRLAVDGVECDNLSDGLHDLQGEGLRGETLFGVPSGALPARVVIKNAPLPVHS